jgi:hypothetical protein
METMIEDHDIKEESESTLDNTGNKFLIYENLFLKIA